MGAFESVQSFPVVLPDLSPVAGEVVRHFQQQGYEVKAEPTITRGWDISISKGGTFKAVLGMKTALKVSLESVGPTTTAKAGIGIFGLQAIPTVISLLFFWPVLIPQIWGMVQTSKLDEEALRVIETSLRSYSSGASGSMAAAGPGAMSGTTAANPQGKFCTNCGTKLAAMAQFCSECGTRAA
jgi:hypothetical protein